MSPDPTPQWRPEPPPQNRIEKLIFNLGKSADHSHMGEWFRLLEESPIRPDARPGRLLREIRTFCARRRDAIAVYAFHPISETTQQAEA